MPVGAEGWPQSSAGEGGERAGGHGGLLVVGDHLSRRLCVCMCVCVSSMMARGSLDTLVSISSVSTCVGAEAYPR